MLIKKSFRNIPLFSILLIIFPLFFLQSLLSMYFWRDDFFMLYLASHNESSFWPYYLIDMLHIPLWKLFYLNPFPYFFTALFIRIFLTYLYYYVVSKVTDNRRLAFVIALIFSVMPVGFEGNLLIITMGKLFVGSGLQFLYILFLYTNRLKLSYLVIFLIFLLIPDRAGGVLLFSYLSLFFLPYFTKTTFNRIKEVCIVTIISSLGIFISRALSSHSAWSEEVISAQNIFLSAINVKAFGFLFFSSLFPSRLWNSYITSQDTISVLGWLCIVICILLIWQVRKKDKKQALYIFIGFCLLISNLTTYYLFQQYLNDSESRYYAPAMLGTCFLIGAILYAFAKRYLLVSGIIIAILFGFLTKSYLDTHYQKHGFYAKIFWTELKKEMPVIIKPTMIVIYYSHKTADHANRLADIIRVAAVPAEASVAVHYGVDYSSIIIADDWEERVLEDNLKRAKEGNFDIKEFIYDGTHLSGKS